VEWNWWRVAIVVVAAVILLGCAVFWFAVPAAMRAVAGAAS
jgi:hypothetical protein